MNDDVGVVGRAVWIQIHAALPVVDQFVGGQCDEAIDRVRRQGGEEFDHDVAHVRGLVVHEVQSRERAVLRYGGHHVDIVA